jgi:hypothetical protein
MAMQFLQTPEKQFETPVYEEDKFSPKTESLLTGISYKNEVISDFSLDKPTGMTSLLSQNNPTSSKPHSSIDLFSLLESEPTVPVPLTPNSAKMIVIYNKHNHNLV